MSVAFDKVTKRRSLGGGDVKLLFMVGLFLGLAGSMLNLLMACLMGLAFAFAQGLSVPSSPGEGEGEGESVRTRAIPVRAGHCRGHGVHAVGGADHPHVVRGVVLTGYAAG